MGHFRKGYLVIPGVFFNTNIFLIFEERFYLFYHPLLYKSIPIHAILIEWGIMEFLFFYKFFKFSFLGFGTLP